MDTSQPNIQGNNPKEEAVIMCHDMRSLTNRVCIGPALSSTASKEKSEKM